MKDFISETSFANLLPNLFYRVHFWGIRRNKDQCDAFRNLQFVCLVPHCSVTYQQDLVIWIRLGQFREKHIHTICIAVGKHQEETLSVLRFHSPVYIAVFADVVAWNRWPLSLPAPAALRLVDASEARFILKHQPYVLAGVLEYYFGVLRFNFFEESCSS